MEALRIQEAVAEPTAIIRNKKEANDMDKAIETSLAGMTQEEKDMERAI